MTLRLAILIALLVFAGAVATGAQTQYGVFSTFYSDILEVSGSARSASREAEREGEEGQPMQNAPEVEAKEGDSLPQFDPEDVVWQKEYGRMGMNTFSQAYLSIGDTSAEVFQFNIEAYSGVHVGSIAGYAKREGDSAESLYVVSGSERDTACKIDFTFSPLDASIVDLDVYKDCYRYGGVGVEFSGTYQIGAVATHPAIRLGDKNAEDHFRTLVGDDLKEFEETAHLYTIEEAEELDAKAYYLNVRGSDSKSVIVFRGDAVWAAVLHGDAVWYYSNVPEYKLRLPKVIEDWADSNFLEYSVVYK